MRLAMSAPAPTTARPARLVSAARQPLPARIQYGRPLSCTQSRSGKRSISAQSVQAEQQAASSNTEDRVPPGCARYTVRLSKPLGLVLEEDKNGNIFVAEIVEGGNAERSGEFSVGDQLIATSGLTYTTQQNYNDNWVKGGEQIVRLNVRGEDFKTVMAAISSHPAHIQVELELQRCR